MPPVLLVAGGCSAFNWSVHIIVSVGLLPSIIHISSKVRGASVFSTFVSPLKQLKLESCWGTTRSVMLCGGRCLFSDLGISLQGRKGSGDKINL